MSGFILDVVNKFDDLVQKIVEYKYDICHAIAFIILVLFWGTLLLWRG